MGAASASATFLVEDSPSSPQIPGVLDAHDDNAHEAHINVDMEIEAETKKLSGAMASLDDIESIDEKLNASLAEPAIVTEKPKLEAKAANDE